MGDARRAGLRLELRVRVNRWLPSRSVPRRASRHRSRPLQAERPDRLPPPPPPRQDRRWYRVVVVGRVARCVISAPPAALLRASGAEAKAKPKLLPLRSCNNVLVAPDFKDELEEESPGPRRSVSYTHLRA